MLPKETHGVFSKQTDQFVYPYHDTHVIVYIIFDESNFVISIAKKFRFKQFSPFWIIFFYKILVTRTEENCFKASTYEMKVLEFPVFGVPKQERLKFKF